MAGELTALWWTLAAVAAIAGLLFVWISFKGRPFTSGEVFRASRLSAGNRIFPTQVAITPTSVVHHKPQWIGKLENSIHMAHVSSVKIDTGIVFSDVLIETSGGSHPILCSGHRKGDAVRMKALIERFQTDYYRPPVGSTPSGR
jgi:hypothetical protein